MRPTGLHSAEGPWRPRTRRALQVPPICAAPEYRSIPRKLQHASRFYGAHVRGRTPYRRAAAVLLGRLKRDSDIGRGPRDGPFPYLGRPRGKRPCVWGCRMPNGLQQPAVVPCAAASMVVVLRLWTSRALHGFLSEWRERERWLRGLRTLVAPHSGQPFGFRQDSRGCVVSYMGVQECGQPAAVSLCGAEAEDRAVERSRDQEHAKSMSRVWDYEGLWIVRPQPVDRTNYNPCDLAFLRVSRAP